MMGDNRGGSQDSRALGPIDEDDLVGRAFVVFWPQRLAVALTLPPARRPFLHEGPRAGLQEPRWPSSAVKASTITSTWSL